MTRRQLISSLFFIIGLLVLDRGLGFVLGRTLEDVQSGEAIGIINRALAHKSREVIVFGSSRAVHHIDPSILTRELGLSCYNAGANGQGILYSRMLESLLIHRHTEARLFLVHVDAKDFSSSRVERAAMFAPFVDEDPLIAEVLADAGPTASLKLRSRAYRFNSLVLPMVRNLLFRRSSDTNGFEPLDGPFHDAEEGEDPTAIEGEDAVGEASSVEVEPDLEGDFREFVRSARSRGIDVVFVTGPRLRRQEWLVRFQPEAFDRLETIAATEGATVIRIDEQRFPVFQDKSLYRDFSHLNARGARLYTRTLAEELERSAVRLGSDESASPNRSTRSMGGPSHG